MKTKKIKLLNRMNELQLLQQKILVDVLFSSDKTHYPRLYKISHKISLRLSSYFNYQIGYLND